MRSGVAPKTWERTNVTNLLRNRQSGTYYARVKVNGKEKWKSLKTSTFSVAKLKLPDFEKKVRAQTLVASQQPAGGDTLMAGFIAAFRVNTANDSGLAPASKARREIAIKALLKTWPEFPQKDARKVSPNECKAWAARALREGTGFVAPKAKTVRVGMSASAFNKCVEVLRGVFEIAQQNGAAYLNPASVIKRAVVQQKAAKLPSATQFQAIVKSISEAGARQSKDCADMVRLLAYSGARLQEAVSLRWEHVDAATNRITIPGTKSHSSNRTIPIFPDLAALLAEIRARRGEEPATASLLAVNECKGALRSACTVVGAKNLTHHSLRHMFTTRAIESGVDIPTISKWLGHADGGALLMRVYGHLLDEHSQRMAAKLNFGNAP